MARLYSVDQSRGKGVLVNGDKFYLGPFKVKIAGERVVLFLNDNGDFYEGDLRDVSINGVLYPGNPGGALEALEFTGDFSSQG